jgi:hypothetical protein
MITRLLTVLIWLLASPVFCLLGLRCLFKRHRFWSVAYRSRIPCRTCGAMTSLVGIWECRCGFTYRGHVLRECPVCQSLPRMVRCFACGTTEVLPEP